MFLSQCQVIVTFGHLGCYASCRVQIMSTTPQKKYSSLGEKFCRLCGSEKDVDHSTNVFSKSGMRKNLAKKISELLQVSIKEGCPLTSADSVKEEY